VEILDEKELFRLENMFIHTGWKIIFECFGDLLAVGASLYFILVIWRLVIFQRCSESREQYSAKPVSIMIPVCGKRPGLYRCLRSCCLQTYPEYQIIFGLHSADDPARSIIEILIAEFPHLDMDLVIDDRRIGANPKMCNLANMYSATRYDTIVMLDSDVMVETGFLGTVVSQFQDCDVGAVTCLYKADPKNNLASRMGALFIDEWFIPSALVDLAWGPMDICYGAAIAVRRSAFDAISGFQALADSPAEDDLLGELMSRCGYRIKLAPCVVSTVVAESSISALFQHELRWLRSVRSDRPVAHFFSIFTHALLPASAFTFLVGKSHAEMALMSAVFIMRLAIHYLVRFRIGVSYAAPLWLLMVREVMDCVLWLTSFASWKMEWAGQRLLATTGSHMRIVPARED